MQFKDYYQVLGVAPDATADAVKKAYRQLARKYHPDVSKEVDAAARMSEVNEAYAVLSDPERRAAYDAVGQGRRQGEAFTPPPDWDAGFEFSGRGFEGMDAGQFSDFFAELFGRAGAGAHRRAAGGRFEMRGQDHHAKIVLDLEDAWRGATRQVTCSWRCISSRIRASVSTARISWPTCRWRRGKLRWVPWCRSNFPMAVR